jgi:cytochrome b6-f complex iron-sulfur subunit
LFWCCRWPTAATRNPRRFHCPCHGSIYDRNGVRRDGPAPRPLDLVKIKVLGDGDVAVAPNEKTKRSDYGPDQAVPYLVSDDGTG